MQVESETSFATRLRSWRGTQHLTTKKLGELTGLGTPAIIALEQGAPPISKDISALRILVGEELEGWTSEALEGDLDTSAGHAITNAHHLSFEKITNIEGNQHPTDEQVFAAFTALFHL
jgi:transcriptional regulator with XRE-family HTH domain